MTPKTRFGNILRLQQLFYSLETVMKLNLVGKFFFWEKKASIVARLSRLTLPALLSAVEWPVALALGSVGFPSL